MQIRLVHFIPIQVTSLFIHKEIFTIETRIKKKKKKKTLNEREKENEEDHPPIVVLL